MSEKIGKHKGAVETLLHEKKELSRLLSIVNSQLERHLGELENQGVDTEQFISELQQSQQRQQKKRQQQARQQQEKRDRGKTQRSGETRQQSSQEEKDVDDMLESKDRDFNPL